MNAPAHAQRPDALVQVGALHAKYARRTGDIPVRLVERLDDTLALGRVAYALQPGRR